MKKVIAIITSALLLSSVAFAARETITCKNKDGYKVSLNFDPDVKIDTVWKKDEKHGSYIETIKLGGLDTKTTTTALLDLSIPSSEFKRPYSGHFRIKEFYEVNGLDEANSGYSYKFNKEAYRGVHGSADGDLWDVMFYYPDTSVRNSENKFPGLLTIQSNFMDQGYYHIDLICISE
jgi:hypothetical protein